MCVGTDNTSTDLPKTIKQHPEAELVFDSPQSQRSSCQK